MNINNDLISHDECRHGTFLTLKSDNTVGESMRRYGEWAEAEVQLFSLLIRSGDIVLEAGANIGSHTVPLARLAGQSGLVHAFEPFGFRVLCSNLLLNNCNNVRTYQATLGAQPSFVQFPDLDPAMPNNFGGIGHTLSAQATSICPELAIDALQLPRLDFLKIDVEGYEREVVTGAGGTIASHRPILFVESLNHHSATLASDGHTQWLIQTLKPLSYRFWHYITPLFNDLNVNGISENAFPGQWSFDIICIPEERGCMVGLPDAETMPMHCGDPYQWRKVEFTT